MKATITIDMDNAAFDGLGGPYPEIVRILKRLSSELAINSSDYKPLMDMNGNKVGKFEVTED